jgi:membrane dipeptidase
MRLIDLHTDWLLQYASQTVIYEPDLYPDVEARLGQIEGYLGGTRAAVLSCFRSEAEWARRTDPWKALMELITRIEAEFAGRLLVSGADFERWESEPESLTWGVLGVEGFDTVIRDPADLGRLATLFERGVRLFQPIYGVTTCLGGSSAEGDDRRLSDMGRAFLERLAEIDSKRGGPKPLIDLAHMNPATASDVLGWLEHDDKRQRSVIPIYSHGAVWNEYCKGPRAMTHDNLVRLRALGGVVGFGVTPPFYDTPDALRASMDHAASTPFRGREGFEGIAIGTDFMGVSRTIPGLTTVPHVLSWVLSAFNRETAELILWRNARELLRDAIGLRRARAVESDSVN